MTDDEPPKLRIAATGDEAAIAQREADYERERALWHIDFYTRELAANMIRVIRGAGRPFRLFEQLDALASAIRDCPAGTTVGQVNDTIIAALSDGLEPDDDAFEGAVYDIEAGALRKVAGRLLRQPLQVAAGNRDLWDAYYRLEGRRAELRKERERTPAPRLSKAQKAAIARAIIAQAEPQAEQKRSTADAMRKRRRELKRD